MLSLRQGDFFGKIHIFSVKSVIRKKRFWQIYLSDICKTCPAESKFSNKTRMLFGRNPTITDQLSQTGTLFSTSPKICIVYVVKRAPALLNGHGGQGKLWARKPDPGYRTGFEIKKHIYESEEKL